MDTTTHWLRIFPRRCESGLIHQSRGIDADLVCSSPQHRVHVIDGAKPPPTVSGMKHWSAARSITLTIVAGRDAGRDVEKTFRPRLVVITQRQFNRIPTLRSSPASACECAPSS